MSRAALSMRLSAATPGGCGRCPKGSQGGRATPPARRPALPARAGKSKGGRKPRSPSSGTLLGYPAQVEASADAAPPAFPPRTRVQSTRTPPVTLPSSSQRLTAEARESSDLPTRSPTLNRSHPAPAEAMSPCPPHAQGKKHFEVSLFHSGARSEACCRIGGGSVLEQI